MHKETCVLSLSGHISRYSTSVYNTPVIFINEVAAYIILYIQ